jgi:mono/diheme cytochrome c family protein
LALAIAAVCFVGATLSAEQAGQAPAAATAAKGNVANGKKLYVDYGCYTCHGYAAQGGAGARLMATPPALPAFIRYVRRPTGQMPPYGEPMVTDQELGDIQAYLASLPRPMDASKIPLLQGLQSK